MSKNEVDAEIKDEEILGQEDTDTEESAAEIPVDESDSQESCDDAESTDDTGVSEELEALVKERTADLEAKVSMAMDKMVRMQAESDNYRKRMLREKEESVRFANERLIMDLLTFMDNLDRALDAAENGGDTKSLVSGLEMARSQLTGTLDKNWGLKVIPAKGEEFDPMKHEACMQTVDESLDKETVIEEFQKGYTLHDRVIRPSKVKIGKPC